MQPPDPDETSLERVNGDSAHDDNTASQRSSSRTIVEDYRPNPLTHNLCVPVAYVAGARPSAGRRSPGGYRSARAYVRQPAEPAGRASRKVERVADERDGRHGVQVGRADEHESREARMRRVPASRQARCGRLTTMISAPCRQAVEVDPRRSRLSCRGDGKHFRRLRGTDCPLR